MIRADRRILMALGALAVALAAGGAYRAGVLPGFPAADKSSADQADGRRGRGDAIVTVTTAQTRIQDVPVTIDAVGTVQALNSVVIRTQVDGRLLRLDFTEGQDVKKGDVLAEIDPALYKAQYDQAVAKKAQDEANLANARVDMARYEKLVAGKFLSQQQYATQKAQVSQLEAQVRADQAAIDNARTTLEYATIRSPIDGRVGIRLVDVGNILHASDQSGIVVITQLKPINVVFTLPQQALPAVQKAQANGVAKVRALGSDNASVIETGELKVVDNQIDQLTGTVKLKSSFANDNLALWPGQFVNVRLMLDTIRNAIVAPSPAVQRGPNGAFVYVLGEDGHANIRSVTTGRQDENIVVVTSGLEPGTTIVTSGFSRLSEGAKVHVIKAEEPVAAAAGPETKPEQINRRQGGAKGEGSPGK
ncbi:efflux RND transporter periplasmic adaptor subunit [Methylocystis sp. MJC1]|uniref:efflux RND transporter periplasmic adaptor subunit n=1 Tax=Methylocystis sp. MJC1 TaxID=2654282 RepID=UPI0013EA1C40|nr:efflux RND transporter periplasmic adaptor subunit [Methylocystis sp. MJC1]KAF2990680.1 Multidrug resistance protein MdtA [Methylocystis sp. MJC1]MBU6528719.1 efflux RND transporter periplasmic adaptor subunit [Methylocystis sp. MJC1]UZX11607.1 efflux RND transporter periplasmic adaptor subunit [Methylocystis sp. MJC1]